jgi:hypothetical protein
MVGRAWHFAGPFAAGKYERDVDVLELPSHGGPPALHDVTASFPSEFVRGGRVGWQGVRAQESGVVDLQPYMGAQAAFGWAIGQLTLKTSGCVSVRVSGAVTLAWLGNRSIALYGVGLQTNVTAGKHHFTLKISGGTYFHAIAAPCPAPHADLAIVKLLPGDWQWGHGKWEQGPPAYDLPDLVDKRLFSEHIHLRVANTGTTALHAVRLHVLASALLAASSSPTTISLAPGQRTVLYTALLLHAHNVSQPLPDSACPLAVNLLVTASEVAQDEAAVLRYANDKRDLCGRPL